jgi:nucleoside-specific outer membrane channel protein Tsx
MYLNTCSANLEYGVNIEIDDESRISLNQTFNLFYDYVEQNNENYKFKSSFLYNIYLLNDGKITAMGMPKKIVEVYKKNKQILEN